MATFWNVLFGLVIVLILGQGAKPLLERVKNSYTLPPPAEALKDKWASLLRGDEGGAVLGHLERLTFFAAFWSDASAVVAAWLAFKVASKWNVWSNIISVPKSIAGIDEVDYLIARRGWGSQVLMRFLIGTLFNVLVGFVAARVGQNGYELVRLACRVVGLNAP